MRFGKEWPYEATLLDQHGGIIIQTVHKTKSSFDMEVHVMKKRIDKGKPNRGKQVPTSIQTRRFNP